MPEAQPRQWHCLWARRRIAWLPSESRRRMRLQSTRQRPQEIDADHRRARTQSLRPPERSEGCAELRRKHVGLLQRGEVSAVRELVVMNQLRIRALRPGPGGLVELVRESADRDRDGDVFRCKERELAFPIQTRR